jgi:hypothetical protein
LFPSCPPCLINDFYDLKPATSTTISHPKPAI